MRWLYDCIPAPRPPPSPHVRSTIKWSDSNKLASNAPWRSWKARADSSKSERAAFATTNDRARGFQRTEDLPQAPPSKALPRRGLDDRMYQTSTGA